MFELPFDKVRSQVREQYVAEKSAELARKEGEAKLAAWKATPSTATGLTPPLVFSRDQPQGQPRALVDAVLHAPVDPLPSWSGVDLGALGYAVVKLDRVLDRPPVDAATAQQQHQQFQQSWGSAEALAYYEFLKQRFEVHIKPPRPAAE